VSNTRFFNGWLFLDIFFRTNLGS